MNNHTYIFAKDIHDHIYIFAKEISLQKRSLCKDIYVHHSQRHIYFLHRTRIDHSKRGVSACL